MKTLEKKPLLRFMAVLFAFTLTIAVVSCKDDDDDDNGPQTITLSSLTAGDIDMNAATPPNNVPSNPVITATFSTDVDASTATSSNITLVRDYDGATIPTNISTSGRTVTITPTEDLASGALHKLTFTSGLRSTGGTSFTSIERNFTTDGFFAPSGMVAYWNFEDNAEDQVGSFNPSDVIDITYVEGRKTEAGKAANFNGSTSIIEIPNGDQLMSDDFTMSFWVNAVAERSHFVIGLAAFHGFQFEIGGDNAKLAATYGYESVGDSTFSEDLWWNGDGMTKDNGGWQGTTINKDMGEAGVRSLFDDKWAHVVVIYNSTTKIGTMFINGEKTKEQDFNLWPDDARQRRATGLQYNGTEPETFNDLAFGFVQSRRGTLWDNEPWGGYDFPDANHFEGQLDDVRIFDKALTEAEVSLMYNSERP